MHYESNIAAESRPFPGALDALESLASAGALLAICTNKREYLTRALLRALNIESRFQGIAGRDTFAVGKPDPAPLAGVIAAAGGHSARAIMVGDSEVDVRTANAAAVPIVFVRFGYGEAPLNLPPDAVIDHFDALGAHAVRLLAGPRRAPGRSVAGAPCRSYATFQPDRSCACSLSQSTISSAYAQALH